MKTAHTIATAALIASASLLAFSADDKPPGKDGQRKGGKSGDVPIEDLGSLFRTEVPSHPLDIVLGRPTKNSITASVLAYADREGMIQFGPKSGALSPR